MYKIYSMQKITFEDIATRGFKAFRLYERLDLRVFKCQSREICSQYLQILQ